MIISCSNRAIIKVEAQKGHDRGSEKLMDIFGQQVQQFIKGVDTASLQQNTDRSIRMALVATGKDELGLMANFFVPQYLRPSKAEDVKNHLALFAVPLHPQEFDELASCDVVISSEQALRQIRLNFPQVFVYKSENPEQTVREILMKKRELSLPLAKNFVPFRSFVQQRWIQSVAVENSLVAALQEISKLTPLSSGAIAGHISEGNSVENNGNAVSTAAIASNHIRLAFLIAASSDSDVGFRNQRGQITAVAAVALGCSLLASRFSNQTETATRIISRAAFAFLSTYATGLALQQYHKLSRSLSREEKSIALEQAYRITRTVLDDVLKRIASSKHSAA